MASKNKNTYKRKKESADFKIEPALKALKKNYIILQFEALQDKCDTLNEQKKILLQEKNNHVEAIMLLEETVKILKIKPSQVEQTSVTL